jgi:1-deoxy-D-xylulose-5-phosphate synthase
MSSTDPRDCPPTPLLDRVNSPADLKALAPEELPRLCEELRAFLLHSVQETGGHLGSGLGVVELAVALHTVFDFPRDRLVWDTSHQCYPHKILTGRRSGFGKLRMTGGLCGFTNPAESDHDLFHTGHAGTSISLATGLAVGARGEGQTRRVVAVIGDASLGAGVAFEAINHAGSVGERVLVILNDNEWSISKSVGALARYLTRIRASRTVQRAQQEVRGLIASIPVIGERVEQRLDAAREVLRHGIVQGHVFEELGTTYVGPVDGHDVLYLVEQLRRVRELEGVVVLHCLTEKGKGHPKAPSHPERVHGVKGSPRPPPVPEPSPDKIPAHAAAARAPSGPAYTQVFGEALVRLAEGDLRVHAITAGMPGGTGLEAFAARFPGRFHDVGITEQHAVGMAAGMAKAGLRPVVAIYSTFLQRGYDQVFQEVALQDLPVLFCLDRAGLVGQDGPTHNGVFDLAFLRALPNLELAAPRDASDLARMLAYGLRAEGPVALRWPRDNVPGHELVPAAERAPIRAGRAEILRDVAAADGGEALWIWAYGALVNQAHEAASALAARGFPVGLVDARFAKPLDEDLLARQAQSARWIVTVEEHQRAAGFGSAVLEALCRLPHAAARVRVLGIPDRFVDHRTSREEQLAEVELDGAGIQRAALACLRAEKSGVDGR